MLQSMGSQRVRHNLATEQQLLQGPCHVPGWGRGAGQRDQGQQCSFILNLPPFSSSAHTPPSPLQTSVVPSSSLCLWEAWAPTRVPQELGCQEHLQPLMLVVQAAPGPVVAAVVAQSCLILFDSMDCSTPGLPVLHCLPEFA